MSLRVFVLLQKHWPDEVSENVYSEVLRVSEENGAISKTVMGQARWLLKYAGLSETVDTDLLLRGLHWGWRGICTFVISSLLPAAV